MKPEEAIHHLHTYSSTLGSGQTTERQHEEAKKMAIEALEKQIPTKPINEPINQSLHYKLCPRCQRKISGMEWGQEYCGDCGQRWSWEGEG